MFTLRRSLPHLLKRQRPTTWRQHQHSSPSHFLFPCPSFSTLSKDSNIKDSNIREQFVPFHKDESGTDWYDSGRSMVSTIIPILDDNYCFVLLASNTSKIVVDPADPFVVKEALSRSHTEIPKGLEAIFCTHKHKDHTAGNFALSQMYDGTNTNALVDDAMEHKVKVYGPSKDGPISSMTHPVKGGNKFAVGGINAIKGACFFSFFGCFDFEFVWFWFFWERKDTPN